MASEITYYLNVYPFPLTNLKVEAGDGCAFSGIPIYNPVSSTGYSVEFTLMFDGTASPSVVVSADGYQSQTVALESSGGTVNVTLVANLPEIEHIQLGGQTYALRDNSLTNKANIDGSNLSAVFPANMGLIWKYQPDNFGGGCLSIPYGNLSDKFKIQVASVKTTSGTNANNFKWTFPVAFDYFCMVVSNGTVNITGKTLSSITVTDNNVGDSTKLGVIDLIAIGI